MVAGGKVSYSLSVRCGSHSGVATERCYASYSGTYAIATKAYPAKPFGVGKCFFLLGAHPNSFPFAGAINVQNN